MRTCIFSLPDPQMTHMQAVDYAKEVGLDAIEPYTRAEFVRPDPEAAKRLGEYAAARGIAIGCFSMMANVVTGDVRAEIERLKGYADTAAAMGSPYLHHTLFPALRPKDCTLPFAEALRRAAEAVREIGDYAEQRGVKCLYEDQGYYFNGVERFDDFIGAVNREIGVVADLGNILFVGEKAEAFVARYAPLIRHVHVKDYLRKDASGPAPGSGWYAARDGGWLRGTVIGHGTVNFVRSFSILQEAGYDGLFSMEYDGMEEAFSANRLGLENMKRFYRIAGADNQR